MLNSLLKFLSVVFLLSLFLCTNDSFAQLTGTKTIPGDYASITLAVTDLNTQGVGAGGVTFNVAAGYTEFITAPIIITATGVTGNAIVFQKSGAGVNPLITRTDAGVLVTSTLGGDGDAIIRIAGTDYITFNGIDVTASDQGIEYGYLTHKPSDTDGCQFVTITNCVVSMTKGTSAFVIGIYIGNGTTSVSSATGVTVTAASGINSDINITGNTIQNVHAGVYVRGSSATGFNDNNVIIGQSGAGNIIQNFGGGSATTTYGVYFIYVNNPTVAYNNINNAGGGGSAHGSTLYGVFYSSGVAGDVVGSNNSFTLANNSASSATQYIYSSNAVTSYTFNNNTFAAGTISSTGTVYLIYASSSTPDVTVSGNSISGTITRGSGTTYCYYNFGSPASGTETITNNDFSNITVTTGTSGLYGIYTNTAVGQNRVCSNNTISNLSHAGTGLIYGLYALSTTTNQVNNNTVHTLSGGGSLYGLYFSGTNPTVYNNNVYNLTTSGSTLYGIYDAGTGTTNCYKNQVYNLTGTNASQTLYGFYITTGTSNSVYNNFVSDLKAPNSASLTGLVGMYVSGGTSIGLYYNTIFLNATSIGANFSASGIYASSTPTLDLRNNIVVNSSTPNGTGLAMAFRRSSTTLTSYSANSNNNSFYAGTPSAANLIFYDGTNSDQTISEFKTRVTPRDAASFSENVPFVNSTTAPFNLHINTSTATQTESGGTPVSTPIAITDDFDGNLRDVSTPDVGADEFAGVGLDLTPPLISYSPLLNTSSVAERSLVVTVTDAGSGVPTTAPGWPNLYWRINAGSWTAATPTGVVGSAYTYALGAGVTTGDVVSYYIVAQDGAIIPNVGAFPSLGAGGFTANPPAASTPPSAPSSYTISAAGLSGDYTVGLLLFNQITGKNITFEKAIRKVIKEVWIEVPTVEKQVEKGMESQDIQTEISVNPAGYSKLMEVEEVSWIPMDNGKLYSGDLFAKKSENPELNFPDGIEGVYSTITAAVADLNLRGVSSATSFSLVDATYPSETFPITINVVNINVPTVVNTVTIKPAAGVTASVLGASATGPVFRIRSSYVTINGSNSGGTTRDLTIENTSTTSPQVIHIGSSGTTPITNVTVRNCNLINGANTSSALVFSDLAGTAGYFNNITIQNNSVQKAYIAIYALATVATGNGSGLLITGNDLNTSGANSVRLVGVYVQGVDGATVSNNNIGNFTTLDASNITGTWFATGTINSNITNNTYGPINSTTGAPRGIVVSSAVPNANISISGNTVTGLTTSYSSAPYGIYVFSTTTGVTVDRNQVGNIWNTNSGGYGSRGIHVNTGLVSSNITLKNNFVWDIKATSDVSATYWGIGIGIEGATSGVNVYYNTVNLFGNQVGYTSGTISTAFGVITSTAAVLDVRNNIFVNTFDNTNSATDKAYAINSVAPNTVYTNINNNDYYVAGTPGILGYLGGDQTTLAAWQTATGQDANSINEIAPFTDSTNLHIPNSTITRLESSGTPIAGITTDIDGETRNATRPDIGADEFTGANPDDILAGDYFIPKGSNPQGFNTLADAITAINSFGVSSAVRFLVDDNLNEVGANLLITRSDLTATNNLIIKPALTKTPSIIITGCATASGATQYSGIACSGASYITIDGSNTVGGTTRDLTIAMNDSLNGRIGITLFGNTDFIAIKNTNIIFQKITILNSSTRGVYANGQASGVVDSLIIENCKIGDDIYAPAYSVSITGSSGSLLYASKVYIKNNELRGVLRSVYFYYGGSAGTTSEISGNIINPTYAPVSGNVVWGMLFNTYNGTFNINDNKMYHLISASTSTNGVYGIGTLTAQSGVVMNIYNNFLGGDFQHTGTGIPASVDVISFQDNIPQANVMYNTIVLNNINKPTAPRLTGIRWGGTANVNITNNIVINENDAATAYALYSAGGTFTSNYNDLYVSGASANIGFSGVARQSFQTWQDSTGQDANSVNVVAPFTAALDFHIPDGTLTPIESGGTPVAWITTDIDGQVRNASTPDIGADEFAGLLQIFAPSNLTAVADTFAILLNWNDNSSNELGFYIERKNGDSLSVDPFVLIDSVGTDVVSYNDLGRTPNTTYTYRVQAYNMLGVSAYSNVITATTIIPVELTSFIANVNDRAISITWTTATELNNSGFELERRLNNDWQKVIFIEGKGTTTEKSNYSYIDKFVFESLQGAVQYRLKQIDYDGSYSYSQVISVEVDFTPKEYTLYQNYPNPFNPSTTIKFALPFDSNVRIAIYNLLGEQVEVLFDQVKEVGYHNLNWNASSLASGVYIYTIEAKSLDGMKNFSSVKKMMLMK